MLCRMHALQLFSRCCTCTARCTQARAACHSAHAGRTVDKRLTSESSCGQVVHGELVYIRRIGKGSFGEVWLAKWRETHVAVKVLSKPHAADGSDERTWPRMIQSMEKASCLLSCTHAWELANLPPVHRLLVTSWLFSVPSLVEAR